MRLFNNLKERGSRLSLFFFKNYAMGVKPGDLIVTREKLISKLHEVCVPVYGEENFQVIDRIVTLFNDEGLSENDTDVILDIKFPKFTITNSRKKQHEITDLVVRLVFQVKRKSENPLSDEMTVKSYLYGRRLTASVGEITSGYAHSHLKGQLLRGYGKWGKFCLGSGPLATMLPEMKSSTHMDLDLLELIIIQLNEYVRWESLEGTPYKEFQYIDKPKNSLNEVNSDIIRDIFKYMIKEIDSTTDFSFMNIYVENGKCKARIDVNNTVFTDLIVTVITKYFIDTSNFIAIKRNGQFFRTTNSGNTSIFNELSHLPYSFRGVSYNRVTEYVEKEEESTQKKKEDDKKYPNPRITEGLEKILTRCIQNCENPKSNNETIQGERQIEIKSIFDVRHQLPPQLNW